ncbi:endothelin-converting enzyme homolog isoform X2 [Agrilus planipennis]|nr:endothelin-converting enzyme homolog isoform X2 [Agrilus planipennis]
MTKYEHADFTDDDTSIGSVHLTEGIGNSAIRYHTGSSMWHRRSLLEKSLLILVGTLLFVVIVLAFLLSSADKTIQESRIIDVESSNRGTTPCLTKSCVHIANIMLQSMDDSVDPCEDFYSYACNGWIKNNPIPEGKSTGDTFMKLIQENQLVIKHVLEQPIGNLKSKAEQKAKLYYESCLDVNDTIEELGAKPLVNLIKKLGGWNITNSNFNVSSWTLQNAMQILQNKYNIGALFSYLVGEDDRNSSRHILQIDQSGLTLPTRDHYLNKTKEHLKILKACLEYMTKVGVLLGGDHNETEKSMRAVLEFETQLANITTPDELRRDEESMYHLMTIAELQDKADFIDWRNFFWDALRKVKKEKLTDKEKVVVYAPQYLGNLSALIKRYENTTEGKIIINNYLVWQVVRTFTGCLSKAFRDAYKGLRKALIGSEGGEEPQWRYCVTDTNNMLGFAIGAIFVREVFHKDSKEQAEVMINEVRTAFKNNFKNLKWMDAETRKAAEIKADAVSDMIGYPDFVLDSNQLDEKFADLVIRVDTYFENNINLIQYTFRKNHEKLNEPVNRTTWSMPPYTVNAYYTPSKNQMVFPAGILQKPFYSSTYPPSLNFGAIGVVMGHELTHGFDDQGREYDKDGNLHKWWNNRTIEKFKERTQCVAQQYSRYKMNGKNLNGNNTLGENIADNGGLKAAYHAFLDLSKSKTEPPPLPGLNMTHKQLFFLAFAQVWCSSVTKEATMLQIEKDQHSPAKYRVIGSLSNLKEFSDVFQCKSGSPMNPKDKCEVW